MRRNNQPLLAGRRGYPLWCDEISQQSSVIDPASILFVIAHGHMALRNVQFGNTPRQRKMKTKHANRCKTHLDVTYHAITIGACQLGCVSDSQLDAYSYLASRAGRP